MQFFGLELYLPFCTEWTLPPQLYEWVHFQQKGCLITLYHHNVLYEFIYLMQTVETWSDAAEQFANVPFIV